MPDFLKAYQDSPQYSISGVTGALAAGAATKLVWYCRHTATDKLSLIKRVELEGLIATTAFAAGQILATLHIARAFTAENGTPGGTALTITGANQRLRSSMATMGMGVVRFSTTAVLGAPTWTLDANPIGSLNTHSSGGVGSATPIIGSQYLPNSGILFDCDLSNGDAPIILGANEGLAIQLAVPATGVWIAGVKMKWAETNGVSI